jgi:L-ascorbate metabolism protein UlaG (beta-lactamase superfamily)
MTGGDRESPKRGDVVSPARGGQSRGLTTRITYVGHATVLIECGGVRLLTDPVLRGRVAHLRRHGPVPKPPPRVDAVLISHLHHDHLDVASLRRLASRPRVVVPKGAGGAMAGTGVPAEELAAGEATEVEGLRIEAVRAEHPSRRWPLAGPDAEPLGFVIGESPSVYFAGDTDVFPEMGRLAPVGVALLPVAGWGPKLGPGHMNPERAAHAVALLRARVAVPIHWGTLHPSLTRPGEWFTSPGEEFAAQVAAVAPEAEVRVLRPGESTEVGA